MLRWLSLTAVLLASAASAQTVTLRISGLTTDTFRFNSGSCADDLQITWTSTLLTTPCSPLRLWSTTDSSCADKPGPTDVSYQDVPQTTLISKRTDFFTIRRTELPIFTESDAGIVCGSESVERTAKICGSYDLAGSFAGSACVTQKAQFLSIIYDMLPPTAPEITELTEQDSALKLKFTADSDTTFVHFFARGPNETDFTERTSVAPTAGTTTHITGLLNGTTYEVRAIAEDSAGNPSTPSETVTGTPRQTSGFWTTFKAAGGTGQGGCSAVSGLPIALAAGLWLMRRKRN